MFPPEGIKGRSINMATRIDRLAERNFLINRLKLRLPVVSRTVRNHESRDQSKISRSSRRDSVCVCVRACETSEDSLLGERARESHGAR